MKANEPLAKRIWQSKAFIVTFAVFALLGIGGSIIAFPEHHSLLKLVFEFIVSLVIALIIGLIVYGIASLIARGKKR